MKLRDVLAYVRCYSVDGGVKNKDWEEAREASGLKPAATKRRFSRQLFRNRLSAFWLERLKVEKDPCFRCLKEIDAITLPLDSNLPCGDAPSNAFLRSYPFGGFPGIDRTFLSIGMDSAQSVQSLYIDSVSTTSQRLETRFV